MPNEDARTASKFAEGDMSAKRGPAPGIGSGRGAALVLTATAFLGLLGVIAAASSSGRAKDDAGLSEALVDVTYTLVIIFTIALAIGLLLLLPFVRTAPVAVTWRAKRFVVGLALVLIIAGVAAPFMRDTEVGRRAAERFESLGWVRDRIEAPNLRSSGPEFQWNLAAVVGVALVGGAAVVARRRLRERTAGADETAELLAGVLDESVAELEDSGDPRGAVIGAYARMERVLAAHGVPRLPHEAPLEYVARVLAELQVDAEAIHALTDLYEQARFSTHAIDPTMKEAALAALRAVRDDLQR